MVFVFVRINKYFGNNEDILRSILFYHLSVTVILSFFLIRYLYKSIKKYRQKIGFGLNDTNIIKGWNIDGTKSEMKEY